MQGAGVAPVGPQDPSALFTRLYDEHRRGVHAYVFGRTGDPEMALDLLQETFLRVWRHLPTVQGLAPERQRYWIFAVARNLVTDFYRSRAAQRAAHQELSHRAERF